MLDQGRSLEHLLSPDLISSIAPEKARLEEVMAAAILTNLSTSAVSGAPSCNLQPRVRLRKLCSSMDRVQNFCYSRILKPPSLKPNMPPSKLASSSLRDIWILSAPH